MLLMRLALMPELLTSVIPDSLSIIILLLILSASMSTLAALVLISSSSVVKDFYAGFINKDASDKRLTNLMRLGSAGFVLISVLIALQKPDTIVIQAIGEIFEYKFHTKFCCLEPDRIRCFFILTDQKVNAIKMKSSMGFNFIGPIAMSPLALRRHIC